MDSIRLYAAQVESRALLTAHESEESRKWRQLVTPLYAFLFMLACIGILLYSYGQVAKALNRTSNLLVQLKRMNRSLKEKNMALERSNKELDSFTYVASHDLKEPLRKILTFCGMADTATPDELPRHLDRIRQSAMRMKQLLNDLLHYSMTVQNNLPLETVDLHQLVTDVQEHLKEDLKETGAAIETRGLPVVQGIPFQLRQLFENLIGNALKYHQKEEAPQILISCCTVPATAVPCAGIKRSRFYHQLRIRDNGAGFSNEYAEKIFEPFQRLPTVHKKEGTGIGLTICKKIIQNHDGFIRAESKPDMGSVFEIYLPV